MRITNLGKKLIGTARNASKKIRVKQPLAGSSTKAWDRNWHTVYLLHGASSDSEVKKRRIVRKNINQKNFIFRLSKQKGI